MVKVYQRLIKENLDARLIMQVHDELIVEAKDSQVDLVKAILKEEMEGSAKLSIPLTHYEIVLKSHFKNAFGQVLFIRKFGAYVGKIALVKLGIDTVLVSPGLFPRHKADYCCGKHAVTEELKHLVGLVRRTSVLASFVAEARSCERLCEKRFVLEGVADLFLNLSVVEFACLFHIVPFVNLIR